MRFRRAIHRVIISAALLLLGHSAQAQLLVAPGTIDQALQQCSRPTPGPVDQYWVPTAEVLGRVQADLGNTVQVQRDLSIQHRLKPLTHYAYEFAGVIVEGQRLIYINAYAGNPGGFTPVVVCDGGNDYWGALWHPQTRRFRDLQINGR